MAFLSLLDDRAKPKGSRDPLGFELIWSHFGRRIIGNLTTITSSMDNFAVALLGFHLAHQLVSLKDDETIRHKKIREVFLRYEQLTGYIRYYGKATDIMGITRIKNRVNDDSFRITLGLSINQQVLSDQASYGLWGLYSTAARDTGLVSGNDRQLTPLGDNIVQSIIRRLGKVNNDLLSMLDTQKPLKREHLKRLGRKFMNAIHHASVQEPLIEALMSGHESNDVQKELWTITKKIFANPTGHPASVDEFIQMVLKHKPSEKLQQYIHDIMHIERILVASNNIFHYCRRKDGKSLDEILKTLKGRYQYAHLPKELPKSEFPRREQLASILAATGSDQISQVINLLMQLNKEVMQQRSGAPWIEIESGKTLRVKVKSETSELRSQKDIEQKWDYDYFLGSFLKIARLQLGYQ